MKRTIASLATHLKDTLVPFRGPDHFLHEDVQYFCQWESRQYAADFLSGKKKTDGDPKWRNSGAVNKEEYTSWSWSGCGMACLKMVLAAKQHKIVPLVTLGKQCLTYGGYQLPLESSPGLFYKPFVNFVVKEYGFPATIAPTLTLTGILRALSHKKYVIASVNPAIRHPQSPAPKNRSGHLILLLGYDLPKQLLYLHNPSGDTKSSQEYAMISFNDFGKFFGKRGIIIG